jgi:hypothetical protein
LYEHFRDWGCGGRIQTLASEAGTKTKSIFSRAQSIPVTRSEHASVPKYGSLKSILRPRRAVTRKETSEVNSMTSRFAEVLASVNSDTDEDDGVGHFSANERRRRDFSPSPIVRTRTAPSSMQHQLALRSFVPVIESNPLPFGLYLPNSPEENSTNSSKHQLRSPQNPLDLHCSDHSEDTLSLL